MFGNERLKYSQRRHAYTLLTKTQIHKRNIDITSQHVMEHDINWGTSRNATNKANKINFFH